MGGRGRCRWIRSEPARRAGGERGGRLGPEYHGTGRPGRFGRHGQLPVPVGRYTRPAATLRSRRPTFPPFICGRSTGRTARATASTGAAPAAMWRPCFTACLLPSAQRPSAVISSGGCWSARGSSAVMRQMPHPAWVLRTATYWSLWPGVRRTYRHRRRKSLRTGCSRATTCCPHQRAARPARVVYAGSLSAGGGAAGGQGYGDVLEREPQAVVNDVRDEIISDWTARNVYHVAYDVATWTADVEEDAGTAQAGACDPAEPGQEL